MHLFYQQRWTDLTKGLVNGFDKTGISIMSINEGLDEGDVLAISETEISICENVEIFYERLKIIGAELIIKVLNNFVIILWE